MQIHLIAVGRMKTGFSYIQPGLDDYLKRLSAYADVSIVEVADELISASKTPDQVMQLEAQRLLPWIKRASFAVALSECGKQFTSEDFSATLFDRLAVDPSNGGMPGTGGGPIIFIVGGALGLHTSVLDACHWTVSLSRMTFPHPLVRLIFLEQLYRAFKISRREPYHK